MLGCLKGLTSYFALLKISGKLLYKYKFTVFAYFGILVAMKGAYCTGPGGMGLGIKCKVCWYRICTVLILHLLYPIILSSAVSLFISFRLS